MVRIRLRRVGGHNQASFRIVATEKESPVKGRFIEVLGSYNPRTEPATISLQEDRIYHWIGKGAQPSDSVWQVFRQAGLDGRYERFKAGEKVEALMAEADAAATSRNVNPRTHRPAPVAATRKKKGKEGAAAAAPVAVPAAAAEAPAVEADAPAAAAPVATPEAPAVEAATTEAPAAEADAPAAE